MADERMSDDEYIEAVNSLDDDDCDPDALDRMAALERSEADELPEIENPAAGGTNE